MVWMPPAFLHASDSLTEYPVSAAKRRQLNPAAIADAGDTALAATATKKRQEISDDEEEQSPGPTPLDGEDMEITGPSVMLQNHIQASKDKYQALSHRTRYALHNSYIGFRRVVHDAQNPGEDAPPLPHASTWFTESGSPAPGITSRDQRAGAGVEEDSDDDIAIARERISTKCPLTLQEF